MTRVFACSFAALLIAAIIAAPAPAQAERAEVPDKAGDVFSPEGANGWTAEGSRPNTDLRRVLVRHETRRVFVKAKYANLKKDIADEITFHAYLRTDDRTLFHVLVHIDPHGLEDSYYLSRYAHLHHRGVRRHPGRDAVRCEHHDVDSAATLSRQSEVGAVPGQGRVLPWWMDCSSTRRDGLARSVSTRTARPWTNRLERG